MQFAFSALVEIFPGDGGTILDQGGGTLAIAADGTLSRNGIKIGSVAVVRVIEPQKVWAVYAIGKSDGKLWQWNGTAWLVVNRATFPLPPFLPLSIVPVPVPPPVPM